MPEMSSMRAPQAFWGLRFPLTLRLTCRSDEVMSRHQPTPIPYDVLIAEATDPSGRFALEHFIVNLERAWL